MNEIPDWLVVVMALLGVPAGWLLIGACRSQFRHPRGPRRPRR